MTTALAPSPQRAYTSFTLSWSLVNIPVSVFTGTESTRVSRKEFIETPTGDIEVGRSPIRKDTGEVVDSADVVRKAEAASGAWVTLSDDEIAEATSTVKGHGEIISFRPSRSVSTCRTASSRCAPRPPRARPIRPPLARSLCSS